MYQRSTEVSSSTFEQPDRHVQLWVKLVTPLIKNFFWEATRCSHTHTHTHTRTHSLHMTFTRVYSVRGSFLDYYTYFPVQEGKLGKITHAVSRLHQSALKQQLIKVWKGVDHSHKPNDTGRPKLHDIVPISSRRAAFLFFFFVFFFTLQFMHQRLEFESKICISCTSMCHVPMATSQSRTACESVFMLRENQPRFHPKWSQLLPQKTTFFEEL